jgi:hypothetical protein
MADAGFVRLSLLVQTAYERILDQLVTSTSGVEPGVTLVSKRVAGHSYWYAQRITSGKKQQTYVGRETPEILSLVERWRQGRVEATNRAELVAMARAGGAYVLRAAEIQVLERLAGAFQIGAVLVGSHAFVVFGNMLGVRWKDAIVRTEDVDLAHDYRIAIALAADAEPVSLTDALDGALPRFSVLNPTDPATTLQVRGTEIQVDVLTPLIGKDREKPIPIPALGVAATPLRFLDYLIEETLPAVALGGSGALVNVPRPGRFALHKILVAGRRGAQLVGTGKATKDRVQAAALLRVLLTDLPGEVTLAWKELAARGRGWVKAFRDSLVRVDAEVVAQLAAVGIPR